MDNPRKVAVRNASDRGQVREAAENDKLAHENLLNDVRAVVARPEGRRVLWWWLSRCGLFRSITETSSMIYVNSGRRDVGLELIKLITEADPKAYLQMQQEAAKLEENRIEPEPTKETES